MFNFGISNFSYCLYYSVFGQVVKGRKNNDQRGVILCYLDKFQVFLPVFVDISQQGAWELKFSSFSHFPGCVGTLFNMFLLNTGGLLKQVWL